MDYKLVFSSRSESETKDALDYYDHIDARLGERFFIELLEAYQKIIAAPQYYSFVSSVRKRNLRDIKLPSFPYVVIYEVAGDVINIISVMNSYRKPFPT